MLESYPAVYRDAHGVIETVITNDGKTLRMSRGALEFEGTDFDAFELSRPVTLPARFRFSGDALCACTLEFEMLVVLVAEAKESPATLRAHLTLGQARGDRGGIDKEVLKLSLHAEGLQLEHSRNTSGSFEEELLSLKERLPSGVSFKNCFGCDLSDYSPAGNGLFGSLACFRENKAAYRSVITKHQLFDLLAVGTSHTVQETFVCTEFQLRQPRRGYRG